MNSILQFIIKFITPPSRMSQPLAIFQGIEEQLINSLLDNFISDVSGK